MRFEVVERGGAWWLVGCGMEGGGGLFSSGGRGVHFSLESCLTERQFEQQLAGKVDLGTWFTSLLRDILFEFHIVVKYTSVRFQSK